MLQLYDFFHPCSVCGQPTDNSKLCDSCIEQMGYMLDTYEADVHTKPKPRKADHNE